MELLKSALVYLLTGEARLIVWKYKPRIIAVTGSVGKTSTKDAIYTVLKEHVSVRKNQKSLNSEFGVPLTIIGRDSGWRNPLSWLVTLVYGLFLIVFPVRYPKWLVLEVGADKPGDIAAITAWLKPDVALITAIPNIPAHIANFRSPEQVAREKKLLAAAVRPGGTAILNGDDEHLSACAGEFPHARFYGIEGAYTFSATHVGIQYEHGVARGMQFRINHNGSSVPVTIHGTLGVASVYAALAAAAVGDVLKMDLVRIGAALNEHEQSPGRMRLLDGVHGTQIIDDTYNASPAAVRAALNVLHELQCDGRKVVVLGDMLELGTYSDTAHDAVGEQVSTVASLLYAVGEGGARIARAAQEAGLNPDRVRHFEKGQWAALAGALSEELREGDVVLVKASQGMRLERVVKGIMLEPRYAEELLVRQSNAWQTIA